MPALPPQTYVPVNGYFDSTANLTPEERARAALTALEPARRAGDLKAAGFIIVNAGANALGNKNGLFAYNRGTTANYTLTVRTNDGTGSGWSGGEHPDWKQLDFPSLSAHAIEKARLSRSPVAIEPGRYTVILEPQAVGDLVQLMAFYLDARESDEGRSAFAKQGDRRPSRHDFFGSSGSPASLSALRWRRTSAITPGMGRSRRAQEAVLLSLLGAKAGRAGDGISDVAQDGRWNDFHG